jgi:hypothetical protein
MKPHTSTTNDEVTSTDPVFTAFLSAQFKAGMALAAESDLLELIPIRGHPPTRYVAEFRCKGLVREGGRIVENDFWAIGIYFPSDYLRMPIDISGLLSYLGPHPEPWSPNMQIGRLPSLICMHVGSGVGLIEILNGLFDLISWNLYSTADEGLNHLASQWARNELSRNPNRFPIDRRPLKTRLRPQNYVAISDESEVVS